MKNDNIFIICKINKLELSPFFDVPLLIALKKGSSLLLTVNNRTMQIIDAFPEASICFQPLFGPFDHAALRTVFSDSKQLANLL